MEKQMSTPPPKTAREKWERNIEENQQKLEDLLEELQPFIAEANERIEQLWHGNPEEADVFAYEVSAKLNMRWPFMGAEFDVVGQGVTTELIASRKSLSWSSVSGDVCNTWFSEGFSDSPSADIEEAPPYVRLKFRRFTEKLSDNLVTITPEVLAYLDSDDITMHYIRSGKTEKTTSANTAEVWQGMKTIVDRIDTDLRVPSSRFYTRTPAEQADDLQGMIDEFEVTLPSIFDEYSIAVNQATTRFLYTVSYEKGAKVTEHIASASYYPFVISGKIIGAVSLDLLENGDKKQYERPSELVTATKGICLVINPHMMQGPLQSYDGGSVLLPIRTTQNFNLTLE